MVSFSYIPYSSSARGVQEDEAMARCGTCGGELQHASDRFCGGDRCLRVFMTPLRAYAVTFSVPDGAAVLPRYVQGTSASPAATVA